MFWDGCGQAIIAIHWKVIAVLKLVKYSQLSTGKALKAETVLHRIDNRYILQRVQRRSRSKVLYKIPIEGVRQTIW
jgi:hypothetical protein